MGQKVLKPGMALTLTGVTAGKWDVRLVDEDEDEDECIVKNQQINASEKFSIDDDLLGCQAATDEE